MFRGNLWLLMLAATISLVTALACGSSPSKCPTVPESADEGFAIDYMVRHEIEESVKDLLHDPRSYEEEAIIARPIFSETRENGSRYYTRVEVES